MKPPHKKEQREKQIRKIYKRFNEICKEKKALGYKKLDKPIRHGWYKEIVITTKVSRYKNEDAILEVFEKIEKAYWGRTKKKPINCGLIMFRDTTSIATSQPWVRNNLTS